MTFYGWLTIVLFAIILTVLALPLGNYLARCTRPAGIPDAAVRVAGADPLPDPAGQSEREQDWKAYAKSLIIFSLAGGCCCT